MRASVLTSPNLRRTHGASKRHGAGRMSREIRATMNSCVAAYMPDIPFALLGGTDAAASVREENAR